MFKLPVCPYCHTVYRYNDVRKNKKIPKNELIECYHCSQNFKQSKTGYAVVFAIAVICAVIVNIIILSVMSDIFKSIIPIIAVSLLALLLAYIFTPFFVKYKKVRKNKRKIDVHRMNG